MFRFLGESLFSSVVFFALFFFSMIFVGCYRMPSQDEWGVIPITNNPDITHERNDNYIPNVSY